MTPTRPRLGELLNEAGIISPEILEAALREAQQANQALGQTLQSKHGVSEHDIFRSLARQRGIRFTTADELLPMADPTVAARVPQRFRDVQQVIPIRFEGTGLVAATCDPTFEMPALSAALGAHELYLRLVTPTDFQRLRTAMDLGQLGTAEVPAPRTAADLSHAEEAVDEEMIRLFDAIVLEAVAARASDIHYEIYGSQPRLRIRVDGDLRDLTHMRITSAQYTSLVNVGKVRARMDIAERRAPQGGRFGVRIHGKAFDVRAQSQPSLHGEHLVLRLLPQEQKPITIAELGFSITMGATFQRLLASPAGLLLVVGPTGSGKSTTLYAGLTVVAKDTSRKVITVEDPIEYSLDGVQQCQVLPEVGFTFANAMRSFVREDPDVILVGEIRDPETALEALRASQTGHLVLSTLHCNDAVDAVQRLLDLGMHPNSVGSELLAIISQRLAKRICPGCREEDPLPDPELMFEIFPGGTPEGFKAFRGRGCDRCFGYGTSGRVAVAEYLPATATLRIGISHQLPLDELRQIARTAGLEPLRNRALELVQDGVIAVRELRDLMPPGALAGE